LAPEERRADVEELRSEAALLADEQTAAVQRAAQIESSLVAIAAALDENRFTEAQQFAEAVLTLDPENAEALAAIETVRRAAQTARQRRAAQTRRQEPSAKPETRKAQAASPPRRAGQEPSKPAANPVDPNTPATVTVDFYSKIPQGVLTLYGDGRQLLREPFRFTEKTGFLRSKKIPGGFTKTLTLAPGEVSLKVYVALDKTRNETVQTQLAPGSVAKLEVRVSENGNLSVQLR
jgi:hypothetical protein